MKKVFTLFGMLLLLSSNISWAQITFNDPNPQAQSPNLFSIDNKIIDNPGDPVIINQGPSQSKSFQLEVWRQAGVVVNGRIEFRYGDAAANLTSPAIASSAVNNSTLGWVPYSGNNAYKPNLRISVGLALGATMHHCGIFKRIEKIAGIIVFRRIYFQHTLTSLVSLPFI